MQQYIKKLPNEPSFKNKDFYEGYILNNTNNGLEVDYINMFKGHEYYQIDESIHIYYVLEGTGIANIAGQNVNIQKGDTIEIPKNTEYAFTGKFKMIEIVFPPFNSNTNIYTRLNDLIK